MDSEGNFYEGVFLKGEKFGPGRLLKKTGSIIEGDFQADNLIKKGFYVDRDKNTYKGDLMNYLANGFGIQVYKNTAQKWVYWGAFVDGKKNGWGFIKFQNGNIYIGEFQDD